MVSSFVQYQVTNSRLYVTTAYSRLSIGRCLVPHLRDLGEIA